MTRMFDHAKPDNHRPEPLPADDLKAHAQAALANAVDAHRKNLKTYESLRNLNEVIGTEYGDRVLYELIQNAHDAHRPDDKGRIAIRLVIRSELEGDLYIANGGTGFRREDVKAIENIGVTAKEIGKGIGHKGLGFRSIETLTDDVRIFSRRGREKTDRFDGYCFRFAQEQEIKSMVRTTGVDAATAREVAKVLPRYLVPCPLHKQPDAVISYARRGYATVIVAPMRTAEAVDLAERQVRALADLDVPLLLFLDRIAECRIDIETPNRSGYRRRLQRRQIEMSDVPGLPGYRIHEVRVRKDRRFLVVRREVDKDRVLDAVQRSISKAPQIKRWMDWEGQPVVSVAVGLSAGAVTEGRIYNFLPMEKTAGSPLKGYLDAPFFTEIDRRNADFDLPLNEILMKAAAEACAATALFVSKHDKNIPRSAVVDLIAWTGEHGEKLDDAFEEAGGSLGDAPIIPTIAVEGRKSWTSLSEVSIWPEGTFSLLNEKEVAKHAGAQLVSDELDNCRRERLEEVADRLDLSLSPASEQLAIWSECFAQSLLDRQAAPRTWSRFYEDLNRLFSAPYKEMSALSGKAVLLDQSKKLRRAGGHNGTSGSGVFARGEASKGKRARDNVPFPPYTLARRYRFLDEKIRLQRQTLNAFIEADLIREYDPVEALAGLKSALGGKANEKRRKDALYWAFKVWRTAGADIEKVLKGAELHVPTLIGWRAAAQVAFSSSWTPLGRTHQNFLVETAEISPDCQRAWDLLLVGFDDWPVSDGGTKSKWIEFLKLLGVDDGLRAVPAQIQGRDQGWGWGHLLSVGHTDEGLDKDWCAEVENTSFQHPSTEYRKKGKAWRLPGQIEHERLPETAKKAFSELVFKHLEAHGTEFLTFKVGRFERGPRQQDECVLPTPIAAFLRSKRWISATTREGECFRKVNECWAARTKQGSPPQFLNCVPDVVRDLIEDNQDFANLVFGNQFGLRDWQSKDTAIERLKELASVAAELASHERSAFRREYQRAWLDAVETGIPLPASLALAVDRSGKLETLSGDAVGKPSVIVTEPAQWFEAEILPSVKWALLEVGVASAGKVTELLDATGMFTPRRLDGTDVRLLVDGERFVPRASDPRLVDGDLNWLPEVVILGHELLGEQLERGIPRTTIERKLQAIRIKHCKEILWVVDEDELSQDVCAFEDTELPTLILSDRLRIDWKTLATKLSREISKLIDGRLRFLEPLLLRLTLDQATVTLEAPTDEALRKALRCNDRKLQDLRAELRTDLGHILHLLMPVVAYFKDVTLAGQLENSANRSGAAFDVSQWLGSQFVDVRFTSQELVDACQRASDRAALQRELSLDYEKFNRVLLELGESPLSNEAALRSLYEGYLGQMRSEIIDRLRRHYAADFRNAHDLTTYMDRKTLKFLEFDPQWILTKETLEYEVVEQHVSRLLSEILGEDKRYDLQPLDPLIERNRKLIRKFAASAISVVGAWCHRNHVPVPEPWQNENPQSVTGRLENTGFFDFEPIVADQAPSLCRRATCWPDGMPETLDSAVLGLDQTEVDEEKKRRERERERKEIERRNIKFGGQLLDIGTPSFAVTLQQLLDDSVIKDAAWFERCRQRTKLAEFDTAYQSKSGGGGHGRKQRRRRQPTDDQRQVMGLAGEYRAFQFLRRRYSEFFDESCWISKNRAHLFGGDEGDDTAGYDFCVTTPQAKWLYEVKSSLEDTGEFELTANEMRVASSVSKDRSRRYRILYVPFVLSPDRWFVLELPNPMREATRNRFKEVGRGSVRFKFERI